MTKRKWDSYNKVFLTNSCCTALQVNRGNAFEKVIIRVLWQRTQDGIHCKNSKRIWDSYYKVILQRDAAGRLLGTEETYLRQLL